MNTYKFDRHSIVGKNFGCRLLDTITHLLVSRGEIIQHIREKGDDFVSDVLGWQTAFQDSS